MRAAVRGGGSSRAAVEARFGSGREEYVAGHRAKENLFVGVEQADEWDDTRLRKASAEEKDASLAQCTKKGYLSRV